MVSNAHASTLADIPSHTSRPMQHACSTDANTSACHAVYVESWPSRGFAGNLSRQGSSSFWLCGAPSQGALQSTSRAARHQSATLHVHQVCFALPHVRIKAMRSPRCGPQTSFGPCAKRHETRDAASGYEAGLGASVPCSSPEERPRRRGGIQTQ